MNKPRESTQSKVSWGNKFFRKLKDMLKKKSIKQQILLAMMLICVISAVALGSIIFTFSKKTIESNYQRACEYNLDVSSGIIEIYLKNIVELSRTLLNNNSFKNAFLWETSDNRYFSAKNATILDRELGDMGEQNVYIQNIGVVNLNGNLNYFSKLNLLSGRMQKYYKEEHILDSDWIAVAAEAEGKEVFYGYNVLFDDNDSTFSLIKELRNPSNGEVMGYLVINIKKSMFEMAFGKTDEGYTTNRYMIIDRKINTSKDGEDGTLIYFNGDLRSKEAILHNYMNGNASGYLFSECHNNISDFEIVNVIEKSELSRDSSYIGLVTVLVCITMMLLCSIIANGISRLISRPLVVLEKTIQTVGDGNFKVEAQFDESEIGKIGNQFKHMVNNNLDLHEKLLQSEIREKEAELLLLQSQINPHFLYNTLDSLYFMAVISQADDIADMVQALSDNFKLSLNKGDKLIRVEDEIRKIEAYMKIQNIRYHNRFELEMEVEEEILGEKILTFILQPIVENAICHGLEPKVEDNCFIILEGFRRKNELIFLIKDNGVGMDYVEQIETGYGIRNTRERLRLFYGEEADMEFYSEKGKGTEVVFRIPVIEEREDVT
ncbi:sensor histidine kinase [Lachnospiraceae bacterium OttesenSCG-928-D06]|nr:sensor histidine kinase [Lachnospiraceae bacterium OttesenSCG-928-D06]